jgi:hypothetical protein
MRIPDALAAIVLILSLSFLAGQPAWAQSGGHSRGVAVHPGPGGPRVEMPPALATGSRAVPARSAPPGNSGSFNRVTTHRVDVLAPSTQAARFSQLGATSANSRLPAVSNRHVPPQRQAVQVRSGTHHNYYPGTRSAPLPHGMAVGGRGRCTLSRAQVLTRAAAQNLR